jgi:zinc D-Ala-D-Ala carboxypeptidase
MLKYLLLPLLILFGLEAGAQIPKTAFKKLEQKSFTEAEILFQDALSKDSTNIYALFGLSRVYANPENSSKDAFLAYKNLYLSYSLFQKQILSNQNKILEALKIDNFENIKKSTEDTLYAFLESKRDVNLTKKFLESCQECLSADISPKVNTLHQTFSFEDAKKLNSIRAYNYFLKDYPDASQVQEAKLLREQLYFESAQQINTVQSYQNFINDHQEDVQLKNKAIELRNQLAFEEALKINTMESMEAFIKKYPDAIQVAQARQHLDTLLIFNKDYLMGKVNLDAHPAFTRIDVNYCRFKDFEQYMHKEAYVAFLKMHEAAAQDGVNLVIVSATRNFYDQVSIWEGKWHGLGQRAPIEKAKNILEYSSMPGTSRHHWGTDIDLNSVYLAYFQSAEGIKMYQWMKDHAHEYGFFQPYTEMGTKRFSGYYEEKWHWSYKPISEKCLQYYVRSIQYQDISGYIGAEMAEVIDVIKNYVLSIEY